MRLPGPLDLAGTLRGGQAFRWQGDGAAYVGVIGSRVVRLRERAGGVDAEAWPPLPMGALESYFRLEPADAERRARLARDPVLAPALAAHPGLRLLRQDPWEATVAFITSANNNVLRIEGIVGKLAALGEPLEAPGLQGDFHAFPDAARVARLTERRLRALGLGYRAPFLRETARAIARGDVDLASLRGAPLAEIRETLLALPGVGPKVADCIALFSLDADDAFPLDRWMLRAVADTFYDGEPRKPREVEAFARERWGRDAGLAQQYLFHAVRLQAGAPGTQALRRPASASDRPPRAEAGTSSVKGGAPFSPSWTRSSR